MLPADYSLVFFTNYCITYLSVETESLNDLAAHVLQPCEGTQDNMVIINLNTNEELVMVSTPFGFSCATNECRDVSANIIGPCELEYMITVRVVNCNSNFSGKNVYIGKKVGLMHMCNVQYNFLYMVACVFCSVNITNKTTKWD